MTYQEFLNKIKLYLSHKNINKEVTIFIVSTCPENVRGVVKANGNEIYVLVNLFENETKRKVMRTVIHEIAHVVVNTTEHDSEFRRAEKEIMNFIKGGKK